MPIFIFLVFLAAALLWLLLSSSYWSLGDLISQIWGDAKDAMNEEDEEDPDIPAENDTADY